MKFSTPDNDNDRWSANCAARDKSGWWYHTCRYINVNEQPPYMYIYIKGGIIFTEMKIRPKDCITQ